MSENAWDIEVLWLAENAYHAGAKLREHAHQEYYQLYYIVEGKGIFLVNQERVAFESGAFFMLVPGVSHGIAEVHVKDGETVRLLEVKFTLRNDELREELAKLPVACRGTVGLQELLYQVFLEGVQKDSHYERVVAGLFSAWLYRAIRLCKDYDSNIKNGEPLPKPTMHIKRYLTEHFSEDISLDVLAEVTGYNKNYLCRIFRENTGTTINHYLNEVRICAAVDLLAGTELELPEIAKRCGYNSVFYFIKAFKKRMGIPPGSYRKNELTGVELVEGYVESVNSAVRTSDVSLLKLTPEEQ